MNKKGFASTAILYSAIILLSIIMFSILSIEKNKYINQKDYIEDTNSKLTTCLRKGNC